MTPGHLGSAAKKSLSVIVLWEALRGIKRRSMIIKLSLLWAPIAFCTCFMHLFIHSFIHSLIHVIPALDQASCWMIETSSGSTWNVGVEDERTNY